MKRKCIIDQIKIGRLQQLNTSIQIFVPITTEIINYFCLNNGTLIVTNQNLYQEHSILQKWLVYVSFAVAILIAHIFIKILVYTLGGTYLQNFKSRGTPTSYDSLVYHSDPVCTIIKMAKKSQTWPRQTILRVLIIFHIPSALNNWNKHQLWQILIENAAQVHQT